VADTRIRCQFGPPFRGRERNVPKHPSASRKPAAQARSTFSASGFDDVEEAWAEIELAPHLDEVVLSCTVGLRKPDPAIYLLTCDRLGVEPEECLFVGDGANDELAGAKRVGMKAVCILPPGRDEPLWPEARGWEPTIRSLEDVLDLV